MLNSTMKDIESSVNDMLTGIQRIKDSEIYAYHHKIEYIFRLVTKTAKTIEDYRKEEN